MVKYTEINIKLVFHEMELLQLHLFIWLIMIAKMYK